MPSVTIRSATSADQPALARLGLAVQNQHAIAHPQIFRPDVTPLSTDYVAAVLEDEHSTLLVAIHAEELVGCVVANLREAPPYPVFRPRTSATVQTLVVDPAMRRMGIGRQLMEAAQAWSSEQGASEIDLTVWDFNESALAFYEHLGYRTIRHTMSLTLARHSGSAAPED